MLSIRAYLIFSGRICLNHGLAVGFVSACLFFHLQAMVFGKQVHVHSDYPFDQSLDVIVQETGLLIFSPRQQE